MCIGFYGVRIGQLTTAVQLPVGASPRQPSIGAPINTNVAIPIPHKSDPEYCLLSEEGSSVGNNTRHVLLFRRFWRNPDPRGHCAAASAWALSKPQTDKWDLVKKVMNFQHQNNVGNFRTSRETTSASRITRLWASFNSNTHFKRFFADVDMQNGLNLFVFIGKKTVCNIRCNKT